MKDVQRIGKRVKGLNISPFLLSLTESQNTFNSITSHESYVSRTLYHLSGFTIEDKITMFIHHHHHYKTNNRSLPSLMILDLLTFLDDFYGKRV